MYLSKKQIKALEIAMEALDFGLTNNVQTEDSAYARYKRSGTEKKEKDEE